LEGVRSPVPKEIEVRGSDFADNAHLPDGLGYLFVQDLEIIKSHSPFLTFIIFSNETIMLHVNTKDNENRRRSRDRPLGLSNRKGTNLKVCPYSVVFGGDFQVKDSQ